MTLNADLPSTSSSFIMRASEEEFGTEISDEDAERSHGVGDAVRATSTRHAAQCEPAPAGPGLLRLAERLALPVESEACSPGRWCTQLPRTNTPTPLRSQTSASSSSVTRSCQPSSPSPDALYASAISVSEDEARLTQQTVPPSCRPVAWRPPGAIASTFRRERCLRRRRPSRPIELPTKASSVTGGGCGQIGRRRSLPADAGARGDAGLAAGQSSRTRQADARRSALELRLAEEPSPQELACARTTAWRRPIGCCGPGARTQKKALRGRDRGGDRHRHLAPAEDCDRREAD